MGCRSSSVVCTIHIISEHESDWLAAMYSENAPPLDVADRITASIPNKLMKLMHQRIVPIIAEADRCVWFVVHDRYSIIEK